MRAIDLCSHAGYGMHTWFLWTFNGLFSPFQHVAPSVIQLRTHPRHSHPAPLPSLSGSQPGRSRLRITFAQPHSSTLQSAWLDRCTRRHLRIASLIKCCVAMTTFALARRQRASTGGQRAVHAPDTKQALKAEQHKSCVHYVCASKDANFRRTHRPSCCQRRLQRALPAAVPPPAAAAAAPRACPPAPAPQVSTTAEVSAALQRNGQCPQKLRKLLRFADQQLPPPAADRAEVVQSQATLWSGTPIMVFFNMSGKNDNADSATCDRRACCASDLEGGPAAAS